MALLDALRKRMGAGKVAPAVTPADESSIQAAALAKEGVTSGAGQQGLVSGENISANIAASQGTQALQQQQLAGVLQQAQQQQQAAGIEQRTEAAKQGLATQQQLFEAQQAATATSTRRGLQLTEEEAAARRKAAEEMKISQLNAQADLALDDMASKRRTTTADLFSSFKAENKVLAARKDAAELEQAAFLLSMRDRDYSAEIKRIGMERELQNEQAWESETARVVLGEQMVELMGKLGWQAEQAKQGREWERQLAEMDINTALQINAANIAQSNTRAMIQGLTGATMAGAKAYGDYTPGATQAGPETGLDEGGYSGMSPTRSTVNTVA